MFLRIEMMNVTGLFFCYRLVENNHIKGYLSAKQLSDVYYVLKKILDLDVAYECINTISSLFVVVPFTKENLLNSAKDLFVDFEDASIDNCCKLFCCDYLITRNIKHFINAKSSVLTPKEFISLYEVIN